jgi:hypothetical protein
MNKQLTTAIVFSVAWGVFGTGLGWSQDAAVGPARSDSAQYNSFKTDIPSSGSTGASLNGQVGRFGPYTANIGEPATSPIRSEIKQIVQQLRQDVDEAAKTDLVKKLQTAVAQYFDEDLKLREDELSKLEERVTKLRGQLERRRKAGPISRALSVILVVLGIAWGLAAWRPHNWLP